MSGRSSTTQAAAAGRSSTGRCERTNDPTMSAALVLGFITGLTYGLLAVGIVLIFRANRFINVAHAQVGVLSALLLWKLVLDKRWNYWVAFPLVLAVGVFIGVLIERLVIRPMLKRRRHTVSLLL